MLFYVLSILSITILGLSPAAEFDLPVTTCKRNLDNYSVCLQHAIEEAWPRFVAGLPEFDFPSLNPIVFEQEKIVLNSSQINGELILLNVTEFGLPMAHFSNVRTHYLDDVFRLEYDIQVPNMFIKTIVKLNGTLSIFKIVTEGNANITMEDVRGTYDLVGHVINDTWVVEHFRSKSLSVTKFKLYYDSFSEDNKEIINLVVIFVNEYWPVLHRVIVPLISETWDPLLTDIANKIFSKVPFSKIFP